MKNKIIYKFLSKITINIKGKNIERFIHRLVNKNIELLNIKYPKRNEANIIIYKKDYEKVLEIKSIYEIDIIGYGGIIKIKKQLNFNKIMILFLLLGLSLLIFLTNVIFNIEVVHNNKDIRTLILKELDNYGIKEISIKKDFNELEKIKQNIIDKHREKIEWLEIEVVGTKYVVRVEERKIPDLLKDYTKRHVIAKKDALIKKVIAKNGEIIRNTNDYVHKGDIVISGNITLNEQIKNTIKAEGTIYGEVWYQTTVEYPLNYYEEKTTGNKKNILVFKLFNKEIELFNFKPYKNKKTKNQILLYNPLLPISLVKQNQQEINIIDEKLTHEQAIKKAEILAKEKIESQLNDNEYIISQKNLKINVENSKIVLEVFFTVYEDITDYIEIIEPE